MARYRACVTRQVAQLTWIEVDAASYEQAEKWALDRALLDPDIEWQDDYDAEPIDYSVEDCIILPTQHKDATS